MELLCLLLTAVSCIPLTTLSLSRQSLQGAQVDFFRFPHKWLSRNPADTCNVLTCSVHPVIPTPPRVLLTLSSHPPPSTARE